MRNLFLLILYGMVMLTPVSRTLNAAGISVDAGLTPAEDRWILRNQVRYMKRGNDPTQMGREMSTYAFSTVLAYGVRPDLTLMVRQTVLYREMSLMGSTERSSGLGDLFVLAKYGAYRVNTPEYTFGIAPSIGLEFPTGDDAFTSDTWDLSTGLYLSGRSGPWATDFNIAYTWNGLLDRGANDMNPGDALSLDLAFAHQFSIGEKARASLAPVLELSYKRIWPDRLHGKGVSNSGESVLYLSPGIKFSTSSLILEALVQVPVWQDQEGSQLERGVNVIVGARFMF